MKLRKTEMKLVSSLFLLPLMFYSAASVSAKDKEECLNPLMGVATCLPYVGGDTKAPTPDCCNGLKSLLKTNKKCLCLIIVYRNDPDVGININVTLALGLPAVCRTPANVSECPDLLHLDPKSPDAKLFYQYGHDSSNRISHSPASSPTGIVASNPTSSPSGAGTPGPSPQQKNDGFKNGKPWVGIKAIITILLLWSFP